MSGDSSTFQDHFLVALGSLAGDYFHKTLTLLIDHSDQGAFGLVINKTTKYRLNEVFPALPKSVDCPVMEGGPVEQDKMFFLHPANETFESTILLDSGIALTTSKDFIDALEQGTQPFMAIVGYAGWGSGQLEQELTENTWLLTPSDQRIVFDTPIEQRPAAAAKLLGVDLHLISAQGGHD